MITCSSCRYAVKLTGVEHYQMTDVDLDIYDHVRGTSYRGEAYECRPHPPAFMEPAPSQLRTAAFPVTFPDDWCADGELPR